MKMIAYYEKNTIGRDWVCGDIHGHFEMLVQAIKDNDVNLDTDRIFTAGDMVNRGPFSNEAADWLSQYFLRSTAGNHEERCIAFVRGDLSASRLFHHGGEWFLKLSRAEQYRHAELFARLPYAIEVQTEKGLVGIVHAECLHNSWEDMKAALCSPDIAVQAQAKHCATNLRTRFKNRIDTPVKGLHRLYVGHTPLPEILQLGNVCFLDGGTYRENGKLNLVPLG